MHVHTDANTHAYDHTDAALKDALKTTEAQIVHQNEEARKLLLSLRLELREIVECIEKNRERTLPVLSSPSIDLGLAS